MENNGSKNSDIGTEKTGPTAPNKKTALPPVMTPKARRRLVKRFVIAFLDGEIEINFTTAREYAAREHGMFGSNIPSTQHFDKEVADKMEFLKYITVFLNETTSEEEIIQTTNKLFEWLISLRIGQRIKGKFIATLESDARIGRLERDVYRIERMLDEMRILLKGAGILP